MLTLVLASRNPGKIHEIKTLLSDLSLALVSLDDFPNMSDIDEDGETFEANALKKARVVCQATGLMTLADDSGLCVDYLKGRPGVFSARYSGPQATAESNNHQLLTELKGVPLEQRTAQYVCVMALVSPQGEEHVVTGTCQGLILEKAQGTGGFGYDPLFFFPPEKRSFGALSPEKKNQHSHRAAALEQVKKIIRNIV